MRTNIDYGPAVLPVGEVLESRNAFLSTATTEKDAARLVTMLTNVYQAPDEHCTPEPSMEDGSAVRSPFDEESLNKHLEQACWKMRQDGCQEIIVKAAPEILPGTWMHIQKTADGLHIHLQSTCDETWHWLQTIAIRLSSHLQRRLHCLVDVTVSAGEDLASSISKDEFAKHDRCL